MTEKGNHIKVRRELEQLSKKHNQIVDEMELLRKELSKMMEDAEAIKNDQVAQKMKMEQLLAEMKTVRLERDRMSRELEDREARDSTLHEQIQVRYADIYIRDLCHNYYAELYYNIIECEFWYNAVEYSTTSV